MEKNNKLWIFQVLISVVLFVIAMMCLVKAQKNRGPNNKAIGSIGNIIMVFISSLLSMMLLLLSTSYRDSFLKLFTHKDERRHVLPWVLAFGILFFFGNMFFFDGLVNAPNPGLARALMTLELICLTVLSFLLFNQRITLLQGIGIFLVVIGAIMVTL